jgi:hypothetical protein
MSRSLGAARPAALFALALSAAIAACNDPFALPPAQLPPIEVPLTLWAMTGTALSEPSAFDMLKQLVARTDRTSDFDFAFDMQVDTLKDTIAVLLPRGALGLFRDGGIQLTTTPYDSITLAPNSGYELGNRVTVKLGDVVLAASRSQSCNFGFIRPLYMKMRVTAIDRAARSITFDTLLDPNCGYRSLRHSSAPPSQ